MLGEGLGYLGAAIAETAPAARLLAVCYSSDVDRHAVRRAAAAWNPSSPVGLGEFLRRSIGELDVEGLRVVEWPASARLFPEVSRQANLAVRTVVRELNGSCATTAAMGRLWMRSAVLNLVSIDAVLQGAPCAPDRPVVIAASGPTLARCLPDIARVRDGIDLWALPSAACALAAGGAPPRPRRADRPGALGDGPPAFRRRAVPSLHAPLRRARRVAGRGAGPAC